MYNGIGLTTPRGSGTNGYVQKNLAFVRDEKPKAARNSYNIETDMRKLDADLIKTPNKAILEHDRKRRIEIQCVEMRDLMEEQGYNDEEIETKVNEYRKALLEHLESGEELPISGDNARQLPKDTHEISEASLVKNDRFRDALGISFLFVEGSSFDEAKRKEREQYEREQREQERREREIAAAQRRERERDKRFDPHEQTRYTFIRPEPPANSKTSEGSKTDATSKQRHDSEKIQHDESDQKKKNEASSSDAKIGEKRRRHRSKSESDGELSNRSESVSGRDEDKKKHKKSKKKSDKSRKSGKRRSPSPSRSRSRSVSQSRSRSSSRNESSRKKHRKQRSDSVDESASDSESAKSDHHQDERRKHKHSRSSKKSKHRRGRERERESPKRRRSSAEKTSSKR